MISERTLILDSDQVKQKIRRIAFEIYEQNFKEKSLVVAGIDGQGYVLATMISRELASITAAEIKLVKVSLDKSAPQQAQVTLDCEVKELKRKCIVLVDDVLNTGKTLAYGLKPFLNIEVKKIETAVLVNRSHANFPIYAHYTGYELATTITDHVEVTLGKESSVYLK